MAKLTQSIIGLITIIGIIFSVYFFMDNKYAKAEEVKQLEQRFEHKITSDALKATQNRLWQLEDKYGRDIDKIKDSDVRKEMKELREEIEMQKEKLKSIMREAK